jgi:hypothetical protein
VLAKRSMYRGRSGRKRTNVVSGFLACEGPVLTNGGEYCARSEFVSTARTRRIFVSFAVEDEEYRNLLRGQSKLGDCPIEYTDLSVKQPWGNSWKAQCRQRIKGCVGVIALISRNTRNADGARWEIKCAVEEGIPVLGLHIHEGDEYIPLELTGKRVIRWTWPGIGNWINNV